MQSMIPAVTLRGHLTATLNDLVEAAALGSIGRCSLICELVSNVVDYQEEGASLFLDVFVTDSISDLTAAVPQGALLKLGTAPRDESGIRVAMKKTAPLVRGCWTMYISPSDGGLEFGLFRDSGNPLNVPIDVAITSGGSAGGRFIRVTKLARDAVHVATHIGTELIVNFTNARAGIANSSQSITDFVALICQGLEAQRGQRCKTYLQSVLARGLRDAHGSLIAVAVERIPAFLADCTKLDPPLDVEAVVDEVRDNPSAIPRLQAVESLIHGMLASDGIVLFDTRARVLAYNGFVRLKASNVVGGARRRAYQGLCEKLGRGIIAAYFQSQDGASELRRHSA